MAQKRKIEYEPEFVSSLIIPTGASVSKPLISTSSGKAEWAVLTNVGIGGEAISTTKIGSEAVTAAKIANGTITAEKIATSTISEARMKNESISLAKLTAAVSKQIPAEHGRSAEMVAGKVTISAPAVTATGAIMISTEGTTMTVAPAVVERTAGTGFKVEAAATSTDRINWVVWTE
jgi:hypothetical protein